MVISKRTVFASLFVIAVVGMAAWQSIAQQQPRTAPPTPRPAMVGIINLETMFESLNEQDDAIKALTNIQTELKNENTRLERKVKDLEDEVSLFEKGSSNQMKALKTLSMATVELRAHGEFANAKISFQESLHLKKLYLRIREKAAAFAERNGYDLILLDDSVGDLPVGDPIETTRQISARRIIYASTAVDITVPLIEFMNKEHAFAQVSDSGASGAAAGAR